MPWHYQQFDWLTRLTCRLDNFHRCRFWDNLLVTLYIYKCDQKVMGLRHFHLGQGHFDILKMRNSLDAIDCLLGELLHCATDLHATEHHLSVSHYMRGSNQR